MKYVLYFSFSSSEKDIFYWGEKEFTKELNKAKLFSLEEAKEKYSRYNKIDARYNYISYDELIVRKIIE